MWRKGNYPTLLVAMQIGNSYYGEQYGGFLKTKLPYNPAIPLLGMYLEKYVVQCSLQHYLQQPRHRSHHNVRQQRNMLCTHI